MDGPIVPHGSQRALSIILAASMASSECPQLLSLYSSGLVRWVKAYEGELPLLHFVRFMLLYRQYYHGPSGHLGLI